MFNIVDYPPGFGECTFCKKHDCGVNEEGEQYWLHSGIELDLGGNIVIGYKCVKLMADNMNITVKVVEKQVLLTPSDEQIGDFVRKAVNKMGIIEPSHIIHTLDRNGIKQWMTEHDVTFVPQWGEERLREEALKHV